VRAERQRLFRTKTAGRLTLGIPIFAEAFLVHQPRRLDGDHLSNAIYPFHAVPV
jgi:hypothetical protein